MPHSCKRSIDNLWANEEESRYHQRLLTNINKEGYYENFNHTFRY